MVEVYTFRGLSNEEDNFYLEVSVRSDQTFLEFHNGLQGGLKYNKGHVASFYLTNQDWEKEKEITLIDMSDDSGGEILNMADTRIKEMIIGKKTRLLYVFDFFFERALNLELVRKELLDNKDAYPKIIACRGTVPPQLIAPGQPTGNMEDFLDDEDPDVDIRMESLDDLDI